VRLGDEDNRPPLSPLDFQSTSEFLVADVDSFKQQETTFVIFNLFILATVLLVHTLLASYWGYLSTSLIAILCGCRHPRIPGSSKIQNKLC
jgi:hypothetical protein